MINTTLDRIVFNVSGPELSNRVRSALELTVKTQLQLTGLSSTDLQSVTTKTNIRAAFAKFVQGRVLSDRKREFDSSYVERALEAYGAKAGHLGKALFDMLMMADPFGPYSYKRSYALHINVGLGLFLLALHSSGAISLPIAFRWPVMRLENNCRTEISGYVASELLRFIRTLNSQSESLPHKAFEAIGGDKSRREWFLSYATKLLLACGWHKPEDVNISDMLEIYTAKLTRKTGKSPPLAYKALLDVLTRAYPERISVSLDDWVAAIKPRSSLKNDVSAIYMVLSRLLERGPRTDHDLLDEMLHMKSSWGRPNRIKSLTKLPFLDVDVKSLSKKWLEVDVNAG